MQLVREPIEVLTPIFLEEISKLSDEFNIILFFDTYERTDDFLDSWLLEIFEARYGEVPVNILFVIAGRQELDKNHWAEYEGLIARLPLQAFTEKAWRDQIWQSYQLNLLYHGLCQTPHKNLSWALNQFLAALKNNRKLATRWAENILDAGKITNVSEVQDWGKKLLGGLKAYEENKYEVAATVFTDLLNNTNILLESRLVALQWRSDIYEQLKQYPKALNDISEAISLAPQEAKYFIKRGGTYFLIERYEDALKDFSSAIRLDPDDKFSLVIRGFIYVLIKRYEDAFKDFGCISKIDPNDKNLLAFRGESYRLMERYQDAFKDFDRAIELYPNDNNLLAGRGESYRLLECYQDAIKDFDRAIEIYPNEKWVIMQRGQTYLSMECYEDALKDFERAIEIDSNYEDALTKQGITHYLIKRTL